MSTDFTGGEDDGWNAREDAVTADYYGDLTDVGMGDVEFKHAEQAHQKLAQQAIYFTGNRFPIASLKRRPDEADLTQRITFYHVSKSNHTCPLVVREGTKEDDGGRLFFVEQYPEVVEEIPHLMHAHGFSLAKVKGNWLKEDLPEPVLDQVLE